MKYFEQKGIWMTSEGLQEGLSEHFDFSYVAQADPSFKSQFAPGEGILLELDGKRYTPDNPPPSISGIKARRIEGKYVPTYPPDWTGL